MNPHRMLFKMELQHKSSFTSKFIYVVASDPTKAEELGRAAFDKHFTSAWHVLANTDTLGFGEPLIIQDTAPPELIDVINKFLSAISGELPQDEYDKLTSMMNRYTYET